MAPELPKSRMPKEKQFLFNLGVKGRKTGLTLPDTGLRDEHGLEPMDDLFSSPEKSTRKPNGMNGINHRANSTLSSDEMEIGESTRSAPTARFQALTRKAGTAPEPTAVLDARASMRMPPPRSKSPIKTYLNSPARRNASLGPRSSPIRAPSAAVRASQESAPAPVRRKLDFGDGSFEGNNTGSANSRRSPQKKINGFAAKSGFAKLSKAPQIAQLSSDEDEDYLEEPAQVSMQNGVEAGEGEDSMQMVGGMDDYGNFEDAAGNASEPGSEASLFMPKSPKSRKRNQRRDFEEKPEEDPEEELVEEPEVMAPKKRFGKRKEVPVVQEVEDQREPKRSRRSFSSLVPEEEDEEPAPQPPKKRGRSSKDTAAMNRNPEAVKPKPARKKQKLAPIAEGESLEVHRGPPLPRNKRGLIILRRETPGDASTMTRSGRTSIKPVAYWKNERIDFVAEEAEDGANGKFILPRFAGVVRADEPEEYRPSKSHHKTSKKSKMKKRASAPEPEDEEDIPEPWELVEGRVVGDVRTWDPEDEGGEPEFVEAEIALSNNAIVTRDVGSGATFRFAKTLTLPFFGSGMVDLPPGGIKKPKNSQTRQLVFFIFYGRVEVSVNDNTFSIGKGGMWQVPRNNYYSISNNTDKPARVFFAQGNELEYADE
ncbi:Mif2/CENP-C like-domain-containing protein [Calycina marina]|uniref:CENP-C homolog n=1 Tax=Calycina marina TaxID=1763456 RepID=A0A9P7YXL5_9HELO|nr:Mif2/CENP-C like-domain-containing protein [Calycina marina]